MPASRKYDEETRARALRMYQERIRDLGESKVTARRAVGAMLDINPFTLRNWVEREEQGSTATKIESLCTSKPRWIGPDCVTLLMAAGDFRLWLRPLEGG